MKTFFAGTNIEITTTSGAYINALVNGIKNDSLYLQQFIVEYLPTTFGTYIIDTIGSYHYKFHYNQIKAIGQWKKATFNTKGSGASLFGGGVLITDKSRAAIKENCKVRGIGVAVRVKVSILFFKVLSLSFTETPNLCSSSMIKSPRSLNFTLFPTN